MQKLLYENMTALTGAVLFSELDGVKRYPLPRNLYTRLGAAAITQAPAEEPASMIEVAAPPTAVRVLVQASDTVINIRFSAVVHFPGLLEADLGRPDVLTVAHIIDARGIHAPLAHIADPNH
jgi:hypothetical protein